MVTINKNAKEELKSVITANRFADGRVVWLTDQGYWSVKLEEAQVISSQSDLEFAQEQAKKDVAAQYIIDPYSVELNSNNIPLTTREQVRAFGPSTHPEFNPRSIQETIPNE
ncbi:DUF2849 domain-containing protein [Commensalibacter papalotli (ex Servin-Garciduenas et al. 2014)]|uniref:DUF2849 domain-containing protein n=1 Tax=Commensalibacter papalotli (ex Servin-Garciduenas et al. 2014) TaxID=1208583 RepID=W7DUE6_9PROT|nr:DUF2849 domain-containing protein [Commensalibacter papalotli (ex Servin-Garciduenas et al. 2014)]EUK17893.1 hypothetical protein COMX_07870 [Commensalibacter papalotli (ex Servin-Garciduenas et al. 2014)]